MNPALRAGETPERDAAVNDTTLACEGVYVGAGVAVVATVVGTVVATTVVGTGVATEVAGAEVAAGVVLVLVLCVQPAKRADTKRRPQTIPIRTSLDAVIFSVIIFTIHTKRITK